MTGPKTEHSTSQHMLSLQEHYEQPSDSKCKMCYKAEHIKHIVTGRTTLAPSDNTKTQ